MEFLVTNLSKWKRKVEEEIENLKNRNVEVWKLDNLYLLIYSNQENQEGFS